VRMMAPDLFTKTLANATLEKISTKFSTGGGGDTI